MGKVSALGPIKTNFHNTLTCRLVWHDQKKILPCRSMDTPCYASAFPSYGLLQPNTHSARLFYRSEKIPRFSSCCFEKKKSSKIDEMPAGALSTATDLS